MRYLKTLVMLSLIMGVTACSVVTPLVSDVALRLLTTKESDFTKMSVAVISVSNTEPIDKIVTSREQMRLWQTGANAVGVITSNPSGIGIVSFDGTITIDGDETIKMAAQNFSFFPTDDNGTKTVIFSNAQGQNHTTTIRIPASIHITGINGAAADAAVLDLTRPVTLQLRYDPELEGKIATVALVTNTGVGPTKLYNTVASFPVAPEVTIPAGAFRNPHTAGGISFTGAASVKYEEDGYLRIKVSVNDYPANSGGFANYRHQRDSYATVPVRVSEQPTSTHASASINEKVELETNRIYRYFGSVYNGFQSLPLRGEGFRLGIASLSVSANLFKQNTTETTTENTSAGTVTFTRTITTFAFPQLDDQYWVQFLSNVHEDLTRTFRSMGYEMVDTDIITAHPAYREFYDVAETNTELLLRKTYRDTKRLVPTGFAESLASVNNAAFFPENALQYRLLKGTQMDAYLNVDINFQVGGGPNNTVVLQPSVNWSLTGFTLMQDGATVELARGIVTGPGVPFSESDFADVNGLDRATQRVRMMELMQRTVRELADKQQAMGATEAWQIAR